MALYSKRRMGNANAQTKVKNQSHRNMRVFLTKDRLEVDAFVVKLPPSAHGDRRFGFRRDVLGHRLLASQTRHFRWDEKQHISIFVEDEDNENICCKHICISLPLPSPTCIILYDV